MFLFPPLPNHRLVVCHEQNIIIHDVLLIQRIFIHPHLHLYLPMVWHKPDRRGQLAMLSNMLDQDATLRLEYQLNWIDFCLSSQNLEFSVLRFGSSEYESRENPAESVLHYRLVVTNYWTIILAVGWGSGKVHYMSFRFICGKTDMCSHCQLTTINYRHPPPYDRLIEAPVAVIFAGALAPCHWSPQ